MLLATRQLLNDVFFQERDVKTNHRRRLEVGYLQQMRHLNHQGTTNLAPI